MKDNYLAFLQKIELQLSEKRVILFSILGQEELLEKFIPSLYSDKKIIQEAYKLYCLISQDKNNQKNLIRFKLESSFCNIYAVKELFNSFEAAYKSVIQKLPRNSSVSSSFYKLKNYFESQIVEEIEEIPDELPSE